MMQKDVLSKGSEDEIDDLLTPLLTVEMSKITGKAGVVASFA